MIAEPTAVATVVSVATAGLAANYANRRRLKAFTSAQVASTVEATRRALRDAVMAPRPVDVCWIDMIKASSVALSQVECHLERRTSTSMPMVARHRSLPDATATERGFVLPRSGAVMEFIDPRAEYHVVLRPARGAGAVELDRRVVTLFVDQLWLALGRMSE